MPNAQEQETKTICNGNEVTGKTPETIKDDSPTKRTSLTERIAAMVGLRLRDKEEMILGTDKSKTFETVSAISTEAGEGGQQITERTTGHSEKPKTESKLSPVVLGYLMLKLEQMDKKLKSSEEHRQEVRREVRLNEN